MSGKISQLSSEIQAQHPAPEPQLPQPALEDPSCSSDKETKSIELSGLPASHAEETFTSIDDTATASSDGEASLQQGFNTGETLETPIGSPQKAFLFNWKKHLVPVATLLARITAILAVWP
jgi:hypothetical protein